MADIGKGIGAALQSFGEGVANWQEQEAKIQQNKALLDQRKLEYNDEKAKRQKELDLLTFGQATTIIQNYGILADKYGEKAAKAYLEKNKATAGQYYDIDMFSVDPKAAAQQIKTYNFLHSKLAASQELTMDEREELSVLDTIMGEKVKNQARELATIEKNARLSKEFGKVHANQRDMSVEAFGYGAEQTKSAPEGTQFNASGQLSLENKPQSPGDTSKNPYLSSFLTAEGKDVAEERQGVAGYKNKIDLLDKTIGLLNKTTTGQISGLAPVRFVKKVFDKNQQLLEHYINTLQVDEFMASAAKLGVKGVDTPTEQERIAGRSVTWKQDPEVLYKVAMRLKAMAIESKLRSNERTEALFNNKVLTDSKYDGAVRIFNPKTNEVKVILQGDEIPKGYTDLDQYLAAPTKIESLKEKGAKFIPDSPTNTQQEQSNTTPGGFVPQFK